MKRRSFLAGSLSLATAGASAATLTLDLEGASVTLDIEGDATAAFVNLTRR